MTVDVLEQDGKHQAEVPFEDALFPCCTPGHPDPYEGCRACATAHPGDTAEDADGGNAMTAGTRDGNGRFTRTPSTARRDAEAAALRAKGRTFDQIATEMKFSSRAKAYEAVMRAYADIPYEQVEEARRLDLERIDRLIEQAWAVMEREHLTVSQGRVVGKQIGWQRDDDGSILRDAEGAPIPEYQDILDDGPLLAAIREIRGLLERRAKIIGYEAPTKHEILTIDAIDAEIRALKEQLGETSSPGSAR